MKIELQGVHVRFGQVAALSGVDLTLEPGLVTVLAGPNGAGKSTLQGVLLGLVRADAGEVKVEGASYRHLPRALRERVGYLPEAVAFPENLSGREVMRFFTMARGLPRTRGEEVLSRVGLAGAAGRQVSGYSRGMRQRLGLGVAIVATPDLLILDEPTGGLDQEGLGLLWEILAEWRSEGRTALGITHDLTLIERRADRVCVLKDGRVRAFGSPAELRRQVGLPVRVSVELADSAAVGGLVHRIQGAGLGSCHAEGSQLRVEVKPEALLDVLRLVDQGEAPPRHLRVEEPGLDEVYETLLEVA